MRFHWHLFVAAAVGWMELLGLFFREREGQPAVLLR